MSEEQHNDLYEKVGALTADVSYLRDRSDSHDKKLDTILQEFAGLKTKVAGIGGIVGSVFTLAISWIWDSFIKK